MESRAVILCDPKEKKKLCVIIQIDRKQLFYRCGYIFSNLSTRHTCLVYSLIRCDVSVVIDLYMFLFLPIYLLSGEMLATIQPSKQKSNERKINEANKTEMLAVWKNLFSVCETNGHDDGNDGFWWWKWRNRNNLVAIRFAHWLCVCVSVMLCVVSISFVIC